MMPGANEMRKYGKKSNCWKKALEQSTVEISRLRALVAERDLKIETSNLELVEARESIDSLAAASNRQTSALARNRRRTSGEYGERQLRDAKKRVDEVVVSEIVRIQSNISDIAGSNSVRSH